MGYKFGNNNSVVSIEIEDKFYPIVLNAKTTDVLKKFGEEAVKMGRDKAEGFDLLDAENLLLDFLAEMLGESELAEILEEIPEESKNAFEYMALCNFITDQIKEQGEKLTNKYAPKVAPVPRKRR